MEGFLGLVSGVVGGLFDWVVGVWSTVVDGGGSPLQMMDFASVLMQFLLICGGSGVLPLIWLRSIGFHIALLVVCGMMRGWWRGCNVGFSCSKR